MNRSEINQAYVANKVKDFKRQAASYDICRKWVRQLEKRYPWLCGDQVQDAGYQHGKAQAEIWRQYMYLRRQMSKVEQVLDGIEKKHGLIARQIVFLQYVEREKQKVLSEEYGICLRTMQRSIHTWMEDAFAYEAE
ncbi:MAG: hypothetical protein U0K47_07530 [Erysipelotrichaceae bacterium]|nr:hypothetical protein [Erysipelotrichaceae bacterium]